MNVTMELHNLNGNVVVVSLPGKYEVCMQCDGKGTQVSPAIDGNGLSAEDFAQDPDFAERYFSGAYDIPCRECMGRRVTPVADVSRCSYAQKRLLVSQRIYEREEAEHRMLVESERRMGA